MSTIGPFGIDFSNPWERAEIVGESTRRASLKYFGALLFFWLDELTSQKAPVDELVQTVNQFVIYFRKEVIEKKWPKPLFPSPNWQELTEKEFDQALIEWLGTQRRWLEHEARIVPQLVVPALPKDSGEAPTPLKYFTMWQLQGLSANARRMLRSGLLQIHGSRLDGTSDCIECCRRAYDLIAGEFNGAGLLGEELLRQSIAEMIADASAGGGWHSESMGSTLPTGIFNVLLGSHFYPPWQVEPFLESLEGRRSHWSGQLMLKPSPSSESGSARGRRPRSDAHRRLATMVESLGSDWEHDPTKLMQLAEWMDSESIPIDKRSRNDIVESWVDKHDTDLLNFVKIVKYRVTQAKK
jgi:hypothetical protein